MRVYRWLLLWFLLGEQYFVLEALYRYILKGGELAHPAMIVVGGLCCTAVGAINQIPRFYTLSVRWQALIGTVITLAVEFVSGYILNIRMGFDIWDYTGLPGNIMGQVSLPFALLWFLAMPFAIWAEDRLRLLIWGDGWKYTLRSIYLELIFRK